MSNGEALDCAVFERLSLQEPMDLEELLQLLPGHSWNQLFAVIDGLSRRRTITLRRVDRCTYHISLGLQVETGRATSSSNETSSSRIYS